MSGIAQHKAARARRRRQQPTEPLTQSQPSRTHSRRQTFFPPPCVSEKVFHFLVCARVCVSVFKQGPSRKGGNAERDSFCVGEGGESQNPFFPLRALHQDMERYVLTERKTAPFVSLPVHPYPYHICCDSLETAARVLRLNQMLVLGYCSHGESRHIGASVTLRRHKKSGTRVVFWGGEGGGLGTLLPGFSFFLSFFFDGFVVDVKRRLAAEKTWLPCILPYPPPFSFPFSNIMRSMSRRGYVPHGGGVFQGMVAAAALCCLPDADIVQYISSCTWRASV